MKKWKLKWFFLGVFALYSLLIFIWGDTGISAMKEQNHIQNQLEKNIMSLLTINQELNRELESYRTDKETIIIQARDLGYLNKNEKILFIDDLSTIQKIKKPGDVIIPVRQTVSIEKYFRLAALLVSFLMLIMTVLSMKNRRFE